jgi:hypothetical protein
MAVSEPLFSFHEVLGGDARDRSDMMAIHSELFPHYGYYHAYMWERSQRPPDADSRFIEHWWLIRVNGEAAAVRYFKYVPGRDCGLALAIGIRPTFRDLTHGLARRFSELLIRRSLEQIGQDAAACGRPVPVGLATEIEPFLLRRYEEEYGFVRLEVNYQEPSYTVEAGRHLDKPLDFRPIPLGVLPVQESTFSLANPEVVINIVLAFLVDHYGLAPDHWIVRRALESIRTIPV